ncbi:hypothetical protein CAEBREN_19352 [Caenorhabditis brenneri]|uniref:Uncharacterized protein n=1 Tax=Caenorhabditis brenneri TaxID=135651 RepID=G0NIC5_CAEBE|nr:hypothetical protein CAEBREN_19352 [Caenorhabditis brenneri]
MSQFQARRVTHFRLKNHVF